MRLGGSQSPNLYKNEFTDNPDLQMFFSGLPQVSADANAKLEAQQSLSELYSALMSLQNGRLMAFLLTSTNPFGLSWVGTYWRWSGTV